MLRLGNKPDDFMILPKSYSPQDYETNVYKAWEEKKLFKPEVHPDGEPFSIVLPPPNATGVLHLGHATMLAIEDVMIRHARMQGKAALWLPGTDHAAIATQTTVEKKIIKEEGKNRHDLGRETFLQRVQAFVEDSKSTIRSQMRAMGASVDWNRERYTLDPALNRVVNEVFIKMFNDGLLYRGHRIVNWDPKGQTTVADDEIEYKTEKTPFYTFKYGPFEISTARPETKFGDKYVVMHPDDPRYAQYKHGDTFEAEWINGPVTATIIKDAAIDMEFGTGVMTITPWHDVTDFEIAQRHNLDKQQIIDFDGKLMGVAGEFAGMPINEARPKIVAKLEAKGLLVNTDEDYTHNVAYGDRAGGKIEPQIKEQWFIDVNKPAVEWKGKKMSLKEMMLDSVRSGDIKIIPERFEKTYFHWTENLRDWCISRQIWWGHRIPAWYKGSEMQVGHNSPGEGWEQDPDTLDTWFSSALWTWSTMIDPKLTENMSLSVADMLSQSPDFERFHPTNVLETGYDILPFWVARMILMTGYVIGDVPFRHVYLHGLVRDKLGRKMSKSLGNGIDPVEMAQKYGADAVRLSLIVGTTPGNDIRMSEEKIANYRNFVNKLWNIARFILTTVKEPSLIHAAPKPATLSDRWILSRLQKLITQIDADLAAFRFSPACEALYEFTWNELADWYVEDAKVEEGKDEILLYLLTTILKLWHPFAPFVSEVLYKEIGKSEDLIVAQWPKADASAIDEAAEKEYSLYQDAVGKIRNFRAEFKIPYTQAFDVSVFSAQADIVKQLEPAIMRKTKISVLTPRAEDHAQKGEATLHFVGGTLFVPMMGLIDVEAEKARLTKEQEQLKNYIAGVEKRLSNEEFVKNAPEAIVEGEKSKLAEAKTKLASIGKHLESLS